MFYGGVVPLMIDAKHSKAERRRLDYRTIVVKHSGNIDNYEEVPDHLKAPPSVTRKISCRLR